jgi:uncharacterized protein
MTKVPVDRLVSLSPGGMASGEASEEAFAADEAVRLGEEVDKAGRAKSLLAAKIMGPPQVIDFHVHLYPQEVAADPVAWSTERGETYWGALVSPHPGRRVQQGWADLERLIADMDRDGVDLAVLQGWYWQSPETCSWHNRYYQQCLQRHPNRLAAFATVQASDRRAALEEVRWAKEAGFAGLGELCPQAHGASLLDPDWMAVFEAAVAADLPVLLHVSEPVGATYPGKTRTPLEEFQLLARALPELRLVLAHWGGLLPFFELNRTCRRDFRNVAYDTAASPVIYDSRVYAAAAAVVGADKILFGSDYPLLTKPKACPEPGFAAALEEVRAAGLDSAACAAVLGGTALRWLKRV